MSVTGDDPDAELGSPGPRRQLVHVLVPVVRPETPKRDRMPSRFFHTVLDHDSVGVPDTRFRAAALQLLATCD